MGLRNASGFRVYHLGFGAQGLEISFKVKSVARPQTLEPQEGGIPDPLSTLNPKSQTPESTVGHGVWELG